MTLTEWIDDFKDKYDTFLHQLAEVGEWEAQVGFDNNGYIGDNSEVAVGTTFEDDGFKIVASGEAAAFIEFGTGVLTQVQRPTVQAPFDISIGSWSRENDGQFMKSGYQYWYYKGVRLDSTAPAGAMQNACAAMEQRCKEIAGRVFG